jgi:hypothetical protein
VDDCVYCVGPGKVLTSEPGPRCEMHADRERHMRAMYARMIPRTESPRFRYYEHRGWRYCWTTERLEGKWVAFVYDPTGRLRHGMTRTFAQRQRAKAQAGRWLAKARTTTTGRLPASMLK